MRSKLKKLGFVLVVWVGLWICLEFVLRFFGYGSYIIYEPNDNLMWIPKADQVGVTVVNHEKITINGDNLRYTSDFEVRDPDEHRVFVFGDSVTMGWGVADHQHYSAVLEQILSDDPEMQSRVRVVSAGVNAYPTAICVRRFIALLESGAQIDTAVLAYSFNTAYEPLVTLGEEQRESFLRKVWLKSVLRRSAIYNLVIEDWLRNAVYYRIRRQLMTGTWETEPSEIDLTENYMASLRSMKEWSDNYGVQLVFLMLGSRDQDDELSSLQSEFLQFAEEYQIQLVNMIDETKDIDHAPLYMDHVHPSVLGHRVIAETLSSVIGEQIRGSFEP